MAEFKIHSSIAGTRDLSRKLQIVPSVTVTKNNLLMFGATTESSKLKAVGATDSAKFLAIETATSTATSLTKILVVPIEGLILEGQFSCVVDGVACASNATTTTVKVALTDGSTSDLRGGLVYIPELGETRIITANTYSSNVVTITVAEPFSAAPTTTHTARVISFGFATAALKGDATTPASKLAGGTRGDEAGGKFRVLDIDMKKKIALVMCV